MKETFEMTSTIPTVQYGNLMPKISATAETFEKAQEIVLERTKVLWDRFSERPLKERSEGKNTPKSAFLEVLTFTGEKILYNADTHEYTDLEGNHLVSGSEYKKSFDKPFDTQLLSGKVGKKYGISPELVAETWKSNSLVSTTFGTALHRAMEHWFRYKQSACAEKEYNLAKHPFLRGAITSFPLKDELVLPELFLSNVKEKMVGQTDGLHWASQAVKEGVVLDYKSDADIQKNLEGHFKQLSFYGKILQLAGWSIPKVQVWNYTDKWEVFESEVLEITSSK